MSKPPLPPVATDNEKRLAALNALCVLDSAPEAGFDEITRYVAKVCDTPTALVSLVDRHRQWFKSKVGFDEDETNLQSSVCAFVVYDGSYLEIPDLSLDPRTLANPLVTGPEAIRFYAGAPLRLSDGTVVGSLCVIDTSPRALTPLQRETLEVMAQQVVARLELRAAIEQAEVLRKEVDHRVKNSLQSLSSLTRIQARKSGDEAVKQALARVQSRIEMIAALHEQLYSTSAEHEVELSEFAQKVGRILQNTSPANIRIDVYFEPCRVEATKASALGVILNEFASNSVKHAFPDGQPGTVRFTCAKTDAGLVIDLSDDGVGSPVNVSSSGLGLAVIDASVTQLGGTWTPLADHKGTAARLFVPKT